MRAKEPAGVCGPVYTSADLARCSRCQLGAAMNVRGWSPTHPRWIIDRSNAYHKACEQPLIQCACKSTDRIGTHSNAVSVPIPSHMEDYKTNRMAAGLSGMVGVDRCILEEIRTLWARGIRTYGSCCGHGQQLSMVNVHEGDVTAMEALGYRPWPQPVETPTFCLTSGTTRLEQEP